DQLLGGHNGHSYLGCRFPAEPAYAAAITEAARRVGSSLADTGVVGRCAVDFVVTRDARGRWHPHAIELNLRKGGTTHPFATLARLTGGTYDPGKAPSPTATGVKHYVASDSLSSPLLHRLSHTDLFDLIQRRRLGYDHLRQRGVVFHMLSALEPLGRIGLTA